MATERTSESEVNDLDVELLVEEDILRLEVTMREALRVHVVNA